MTPVEHITPPDLKALKAELARVKDEASVSKRLSTELQRELALLRTQLIQVTQAQETITGAVAQLTTKHAKAHRDRASGTPREETANPIPAAPEDEVTRADTQRQAQVNLIEDTMLAETPDAAWADAAKQSLHSALQREEQTAFHLVQAECRTSMCRLELSLDGSITVEESFRHLVYFIPWKGEAFVRMEDGESATAVVFLAREGRALPRAVE